MTREITELIGAAACENTEQCRLIALGHKPCGGPAAYRAYSTPGTDAALMETRISEYNRLSEQYNRETNAISDCAMVVAPMVQCIDGRCRTTTGESEGEYHATRSSRCERLSTASR